MVPFVMFSFFCNINIGNRGITPIAYLIPFVLTAYSVTACTWTTVRKCWISVDHEDIYGIVFLGAQFIVAQFCAEPVFLWQYWYGVVAKKDWEWRSFWGLLDFLGGFFFIGLFLLSINERQCKPFLFLNVNYYYLFPYVTLASLF